MYKAIHQHLEMDNFFTGFCLKDMDLPVSHQTNPVYTDKQRAQGLAEIAREISSCKKCPLHTTRKNTVPGEGKHTARIMFVGTAPGTDEDNQGRPFTGKAGQLLDKIITACHLKREDVYLTNILKCMPVNSTSPHTEEINQCIYYLNAQIKYIHPEIIIALGQHAACALLQCNMQIDELRAQFYQYPLSSPAKPIKIMPTYSPDYLLQNYTTENRTRVWQDMQKVMSQLGISV